MTTIEFYSVTAEYGELSNFAPYPIKLKGKLSPTSEHYFQAQKFADAAEAGADPQGELADARGADGARSQAQAAP
jgi:predicted NAD-dependent protein-ADP-ribosyltransferase YbiA (DUF1768 family)